MPVFQYKVQEPSGKLVEGEKTASDKRALSNEFEKEGNTVIVIREKTKSRGFDRINVALSRVKLEEKILFARNLSAMIDSGLPLARALDVLKRQSRNPRFVHTMSVLSNDIAKGVTLSDSLAKFPKVFSGLFVSMVRVGEESGNLAESLESVGTQLDRSYKLKQKVKGAMMYPSIVISVMILIGILMMIYVVPTLTETFKEIDMELPVSTQIVIGISDAMAENTILVFMALIGFVVSVTMFARTRIGKRTLDFAFLHFPIVQGIVKQYNTAQTARTLSSLLSSGVGVLDALTITQEVLQNSYYKGVLAEAADEVQKGIPFSSSFKKYDKLYPILASEMVEVGEETGQLSEMLLRVAEFYEGEVESITKNLTTVIEPILMVVIGSVVGFFALSMISPMYSITSAI